MQGLALSSVTRWTTVDGWWFPQSLDTLCPLCGRMVNIYPTHPSYDPIRRTMAATASCPGCQGTLYLWVVEPGPASDPKATTCGGLLMYPLPRQMHQPVPGTDLLPQRIAMLYTQAVTVHNAGLWDVSVGCCRQTLEAVARTLLPSYEIQDNLSQNIRRLSSSLELKRPIVDLAFLLREGSKLGVHVELARGPDEDTARMILAITEYILQYVCTIPKLAADLKVRVEGNRPDVRMAG